MARGGVRCAAHLFDHQGQIVNLRGRGWLVREEATQVEQRLLFFTRELQKKTVYELQAIGAAKGLMV